MSKPNFNELPHLVEQLNLEKTEEIPLHLTWYALEIKKEDKVQLEQTVKELDNFYLPIDSKIFGINTSHYKTVRFIVENTKEMQNFHKRIVKTLSQFRDKEAQSKAKRFYNELSDEEQKLVNLYGRANVIQKFYPHITIGKSQLQIKRNLNQPISFNNLTAYI